MNKKGFTLIELLAVIIILGILMIIAIPSVTRYISDSRKSAYIDTAKEVISGTRNLVNGGTLEMYDTGTTYYIPVNYISTENALKSPYGEFTQAYVGITYDGNGYDYYWISVDDAGQGVEYITKLELLNEDDVVSDLSDEEIENRAKTTGIDGRSKILILDENGNWSNEYYATGFTIGKETETIQYPSNKEKKELEVGDIVTIGTEEFYVLSNNGKDITLLAHYNLKVGKIYNNSSQTIIGEYTPDDPGYGMQSSEALGKTSDSNISKGVIGFANTHYWENEDGSLKSQYEGSYSIGNYPYIYDNNSILYSYIINYVKKLGINVKEARILKASEAMKLGCKFQSNGCSSAPSFITETSFWVGNAVSTHSVLEITKGMGFSVFRLDHHNPSLGESYEIDSFPESRYVGIRPVIVI